MQQSRIVQADNLDYLQGLEDGLAPLIYIDPPFGSGRTRRRRSIRAVQDEEEGDHLGFGGKRYRTEVLSEHAFGDSFDDYQAFLRPRLEEARRLLSETGSLFVHLDWREVHYTKVALDGIFGRDCFQNELIWAYDYGGRSRRRWPAKHDTILWYTRHPRDYCYDADATDRIPYMAPGLVSKEKAARGKSPTDVWWHTIVTTTGKERTGYPTQKPLGVLERIVKVHSGPGDLVLDFFAGSGTTGEAAALHGRPFLLVDSNPEAIAIMSQRLERFAPLVEVHGPGSHSEGGSP